MSSSHPTDSTATLAGNGLQPVLIERILKPFAQFAHTASAGGIVLLLATAVALAWANSPWAASYHHLWELAIALNIGPFAIRSTLHHLINDGLMAVFFFLVGLEIKREVLDRRAGLVSTGGAAGGRRAGRHGRAGRDLCRAQLRRPRARRAGACRWRRTSLSRSACSRCWAAACRRG